ncbi:MULTISPECIES: flavin reductase family protein [Burkholderia]|uniref:flavin reductase family protein n=1 Tax=Burkholderia TaxID=32008 RepID=UPI001C8AFBB5|nr:flavin reductase family protein [Burkholderia sp. Bp9131]
MNARAEYVAQPDVRALFLEAMSHLPGPVALITTGSGAKRMGLTVSAICSLSADPPSLLTCINKNASAHDELVARGVFGVNVLRPSQVDMASLFTQKGVDRFASSDWTERATGAPLLSTALVTFDCRLKEAIDGFSHTILIGTVDSIEIAEDEDRNCLMWHQRRYRTIAEIG